MKREIADLKAGQDELRSENRRMMATLVRLEGKMDDMSDRITGMATKDDISMVLNHIDGLAARVESSELRGAIHKDILSDHDRRLKKLESRRS